VEAGPYRSDRRLRRGEVRIWAVDLDSESARLGESCASLDEVERARAAKFRFPIDRMRFIAARSTLKSILALETGGAVDEIRLLAREDGKPILAAGGDPLLHFNLTHSLGRALVAVAHCEVGVDLEAMRAQHASDQVAEVVFSSRELSAYRAVPAEARRRSFYKGWTSKEAYLKGLGHGLTTPLKLVEVCVDPSAPARVLTPLPGVAVAWHLTTLEAPVGFVATLASAAPPDRILQRRW
jgi:4'-phosphopantetheinyl transferase